MAESAEELHARVRAAYADGRPPLPESVGWEIFPWEVVDGALAAKRLSAPADEEPRAGEGGRPCPACARQELGDADRLVWSDEHWDLIHLGGPSGMPVVLLLNSREHLDFGRLSDDLASEHGRITNRLVRIVESLDGVGRCHVHRWGDGGAHSHVWFVGRPERVGILGSYAIEWDDLLPPVPEASWRADLHTIATKLANWGGEVHVTS